MRLAKGSAVATNLKSIWKSHDIKVTTKMELLRTLVWPVAIYGCEGWTTKTDAERDSKGEKNEILWTHHEKGGIMLGKGDHSRHGSGRLGKGKTEDQLDG